MAKQVELFPGVAGASPLARARYCVLVAAVVEPIVLDAPESEVVDAD